ncbi:hypothetical protein GCM10027285_23430 [Oleiagrimonas citrea]|uniref:Uncharacterized protein n=1 Tax=Oleiagrimonas citrea TaxID=1665687 RepID=A0A846ZI02_9GAMM|nr:TniB family NTP-binding protein [Oleiagrimonas citrea]NKZ37343.1 hypothetical protein [Oleiagrimonas citrea]
MSAAYPHLPEATAKLVDLPVIERVGYVLTDRYVYHEQAADLIRHVDFMVNKPRGVRPTGMVLASPSNSGKTAFAEALVRRYTSRVATDQHPASRPTVMISMSGAHQVRIPAMVDHRSGNS